jgi:hypothetical protein
MKKYLVVVALLLSATMLPANASITPVKSVTEVVPSIAVIDTGLNGMWFNSSLVAEACFVEFGNCINGRLQWKVQEQQHFQQQRVLH